MRSRTRKAPASPCDAWAINPPIGELLRDPKDHCLGSRNLRDGLPPAPCLACNGGPDKCPARPKRSARPTSVFCTFNGGPDNRPARPTHATTDHRVRRPFNGGPNNRPARHCACWMPATTTWTFNGGPDNRPTRPTEQPQRPVQGYGLQWRAGQLSGQT